MDNNIRFALIYIRNGEETIFPVKDVDQAVRLADAIADSDLLNNDVDYNMFDVYEYHDGQIGNPWIVEENGTEFNDYWSMSRFLENLVGKPMLDYSDKIPLIERMHITDCIHDDDNLCDWPKVLSAFIEEDGYPYRLVEHKITRVVDGCPKTYDVWEIVKLSTL